MIGGPAGYNTLLPTLIIKEAELKLLRNLSANPSDRSQPQDHGSVKPNNAAPAAGQSAARIKLDVLGAIQDAALSLSTASPASRSSSPDEDAEKTATAPRGALSDRYFSDDSIVMNSPDRVVPATSDYPQKILQQPYPGLLVSIATRAPDSAATDFPRFAATREGREAALFVRRRIGRDKLVLVVTGLSSIALLVYFALR